MSCARSAAVFFNLATLTLLPSRSDTNTGKVTSGCVALLFRERELVAYMCGHGPGTVGHCTTVQWNAMLGALTRAVYLHYLV